jgi:hypothetical protein
MMDAMENLVMDYELFAIADPGGTVITLHCPGDPTRRSLDVLARLSNIKIFSRMMLLDE